MRRRPVLGAAVAALVSLVAPAATGAPASAVERPRIIGAGHPDALAGHYLVIYRDASTDLTRAPGVTSVTVRYTAPPGFAGRMSEVTARALAARPDVAFVEQDRRSVADERLAESDAVQPNPSNWGLDRIDQATLPLDGSYSYTATAAEVRAYVVGDGIAPHPDFASRLLPGVNTTGDGLPYCPAGNVGVEEAGLIGGTVTGVAKAVRLVPVKVSTCDVPANATSWTVAGVNWVTANHVKPAVALHSASWGAPASTAIRAAIESSIAAGVPWVAPAGNFGGDACQWTPANIPAVITVSATDIADRRPSWANLGPCVDLFAPGVGVVTTKFGGGHGAVSHTWHAAAMTVGVAAQHLSGHPAATPAQVHAALVGAATPGVVIGAGTGSPNRLLRTVW